MRLDDALIQRFVNHSMAKGNSTKWVREQTRHLRALAKQLRGRELRSLPLRELHPLVVGQAHKIATIKALYAYLRKVTYELEPSEDPTVLRLVVPQRRPQLADKALDPRVVRRAVRKLREPWKSRLALQAATGIHTTELQRFAKNGKLHPYHGQRGAHSFLVVPHKRGDEHRVALNRALTRAARRVVDAGPFTCEFYHKHVIAAAGFTPGRLRHTVATELVNRGTDMATVATFLGHRTPQTTKKWYARFAVPRNPFLAKLGRQR